METKTTSTVKTYTKTPTKAGGTAKPRRRKAYIVWVKEDKIWEPNGDGPVSLKTGERMVREIQAECRVPARVLPEGESPL